MKLKVTNPIEESPPSKGKKLKIQYKSYSGIVNDKGKNIDTPTETEAIKNMAQYMKNNQSDQSDKSSNVYRPQFSHITQAYKKKNLNEA